VRFPEGFLWGAATSAHGVEGGDVYNDAWAMEHAEGSPHVEPSGDACDHYHRYPEDIALLAELGLNAYRFSIEWSRIEPEDGEFSRAALEHYRRMLGVCHDHGIVPVVSFHHFTSPRWLHRHGGWEDAETPDRFGRFCEQAAAHLGDLVTYACTLNEPNLPRFREAAFGLQGDRTQPWWREAARLVGADVRRFVPFSHAASDRARDVMMRAHARGVEAIKSVNADCLVGLTLALIVFEAAPGGEGEALWIDRRCNTDFLEAVRGDDFIGVQTYTRFRVGPGGVLPPGEHVERTQVGWEFWPEALEVMVRRAAEVAGIPTIVTENGVATDDDSRRIEYIERAVRGLGRCLTDGIDVRGYLHWTLLDNFEWSEGCRPTFGLIAVDRRTQQRSVKPSARRLGEIARVNAVPRNTHLRSRMQDRGKE
jgi:beta-glucosidase